MNRLRPLPLLLSLLAYAVGEPPAEPLPPLDPEDGPPCRHEGCTCRSAYGYIFKVYTGLVSQPVETRFVELTTCRAHEIRDWKDVFPDLDPFQVLIPDGRKVSHVIVERHPWNDFPAVPDPEVA